MQIIDSRQYDPAKPIDPSMLHEAREGERVRVRYSPTPERAVDGYGVLREIERHGTAVVAMEDGTTERVGAGCLSWPGEDA